MEKKITLTFLTVLILLIVQKEVFASILRLSCGEIPASQTLPIDSPKKEQAPLPQMPTFPISSITAKMTLNGYSQVRYQYYLDDKMPSNFDIRNARLILRGTVLKNFAYNFQCDFAPPTVRLMDATAAYTFNNYLKITAGQQKVPLSYESLRTDYDIHSVSRSQVVEALTARSKDVIATAGSTTAVNNNGRDIGVVLSGFISNLNTQFKYLEYSAGVFNGNGINKTDADKKKDIGARLVGHPLKNLGIGASIYQGMATYGGDITTPKGRNRWGVDASYEDGKRIYAAAEFLQGTDSATTKKGYYALLEGYILPKKFSALVKYDVYDPNTDKDNDANSVYSFALNYYWSQFTKIQLQYDLRHEDGADVEQKKNDLITVQHRYFSRY